MTNIASTKVSKRDGEFIVKAYDANGKRLPDGDYFTNDKDDAEQTAKLMIQ